MNDQWERECVDLRAELAALQNRLHALEGKRAGSTGNAPTLSRRRMSKRMMLGMLPAVVLLAAGGTLYGQSALDALFIDPRGYVGVGTDRPGEKLEVKGGKIQLDGDQQLKFTDADTSNNLKLQLWTGFGLGINPNTLFYAAMGRHSWRDWTGTNERMALTTGADGGLTVLGTGASSFAGNVGIGTLTAGARLSLVAPGATELAGTARSAILVTSAGDLGTSANSELALATIGFRSGNNSSLGIRALRVADGPDWYSTAIGLGMDVDNTPRAGGASLWLHANGNVGIGTTDPKARLDVNGDIKATSVNGEKPPLVFEVGQKGDTQKWYAVNQDIGPLCGDADGCTMKFFLRVNDSDEVRTISEQIYIEQRNKSSNKSPGLHGWARQLGGGDQKFVLNTAEKNEIVPHPWNYIYVRNYQSPEVGKTSNAFNGYQVQFMTRPNVSATVIIYDR